MGGASITVIATYVLCGVLLLLLVPYLLKHRGKPGSTGLLTTISGLVLWALSSGAMHAGAGYRSRLIAMSVFFAGITLAGVGYYVVAAEYTGCPYISRSLLAALAVPALAIQVLSVTDPYHGLVWERGTAGNVTVTEPGPAFFAYVLFVIVVASSGAALFVREAIVSSGVRRLQTLVLLATGVPPLVFGALSAFVISDLSYPLVPLSFVLSAFFYAWALFRADVLEVGRIGRDRVVEELDDAVVTLDADGKVVDANPAARRIAGVSGSGTGLDVREFFADLPAALPYVERSDDVDTGFSLPVDGAERHFHFQSSEIRSNGRPAGRLLVLRDVTTLKRRERALSEREQELDLLRQVLSRALRHNIRNELTVVRGYADAVASDTAADHERLAASIVERCDALVDMSEKAATIERLVTDDGPSAPVALDDLLASIVDRNRERFPSVEFDLVLPDCGDVEVDGSLAFAFENLVENAAEHGAANADSTPYDAAADGGDRRSRPAPSDGGAEPTNGSSGERDGAAAVDAGADRDVAATVRVATRLSTSRATVTVADDGPGIPEQELAVLERGEETPLQHGSGIGLWIVHWIVEHSDASITFDTGEEGTSVTVGIPR